MPTSARQRASSKAGTHSANASVADPNRELRGPSVRSRSSSSQAQPPAALAARLPRREPRPRDAGRAQGSRTRRQRPPPLGPGKRRMRVAFPPDCDSSARRELVHSRARPSLADTRSRAWSSSKAAGPEMPLGST
jgi:hypothetical protein